MWAELRSVRVRVVLSKRQGVRDCGEVVDRLAATPLKFAGTIEDMVFNSVSRALNEHYKVDGSKERYKQYLNGQETGFMATKFMNDIFSFAESIYLQGSSPDLKLDALLKDINGVSHQIMITATLQACEADV